ncbi:hypothetical protein JCM10207_002108 [Rhodosporidiobolus poonsookiae]
MHLPLLALAASTLLPLALATHSHQKPAHKRSHGIKRASGYSLRHDFSGERFFDAFNFASRPPLPFPTSSDTTRSNGGIANFVDAATAAKEHLIEVKDDGTAHIRVHPKVNGDGTIDAVKITTKEQYGEGLYVWDVERMPQVCGVWPAIWSTGDNWPENGEIDLVEYVSHQTKNSFSVHTASGCWAGSTGYSGKSMLDGENALNCDAEATTAQGCGFRSHSLNTAGIGANPSRGGLYALEWARAGLKAWYFPRDDVPQDLKEGRPDPEAWGTPSMWIAREGCEPEVYFGPQTWVVNTQICGNWPNGVWDTDNSYAGQEGSCAADTGYATCEEYVRNTPEDFEHAYWRIGSFRIYNK